MKFSLQQEEEEIGFQMGPMIDVVFQLLIFFMCISSMANISQVEEIKLPVADAAKTKENTPPGEAVLNVKSDGSVLIDGVKYQADELTELFKKDAKKRSVTITIRGDKKALHGQILKIMRACAAAGIYEISFAALKEKK